MLTLLIYASSGGGAGDGFAWMESEMRALREAYSLVALASHTVVVTLPYWFVAPTASGLATSVHGVGEDVGGDEKEEEVTVLPLSSLPPLASAADGFVEESTIRQASVWARLTHPYIARLGGACHVGESRFFAVNAHLEPLVRVEPSGQGDDGDMVDFVLSKLREASAAMRFLHERGLTYSVGSGDTSRLNPTRVYSSPESSTVQLLGVGLMDLTRSEVLVAMRSDEHRAGQQDDQQQSRPEAPVETAEARAQADDVYRVGVWMADLVTDSQSALQLSAELWELIDAMCRPSPAERTSTYCVTRLIEIMLRYRAEGADRMARFWRVLGNPRLSPEGANSAVEEMLAKIVEISSDTNVSSRILGSFRLLQDPDRQLPALALGEFCFRCADILEKLRQLSDRDVAWDTGVAGEDSIAQHQDSGAFESIPHWALSGLKGVCRLLMRLEPPVDFGGHQLPVDRCSIVAPANFARRSDLPWHVRPRWVCFRISR